MPFDQTTRNRLARFVGDARDLLTAEFTRQFAQDYGIDSASGEVADLSSLMGKSDVQYQTAHLLRETAQHYLPGFATRPARECRDILDRMVREQAFTVLNRLAALRMAESRGLLIESLAAGYQSKGFQLYHRIAGTSLGETGDAYRCYLFSLFDELAVDLPVLFARFAPEGRLFPGETALLLLLGMINHPDISDLWAEDETLGWIYQYFNSQDERKAMRAASAAPRNSRELAVRNQFFTPRYVVEFLTDNTLGRTWYEMTKGQTGLVESCRYLVRRPNEVFRDQVSVVSDQVSVVSDQVSVVSDQVSVVRDQVSVAHEGSELLTTDLSQEELLSQPVHIPHRPLKDPRGILMLDPACGSMHFGLYAFDLFERIYDEAWEIEAERGPSALERVPMDAALHEVYASKEDFLRDVPRLIVERNIHGVDIDPRAVQIAGLSLWLRAQRRWREQGVRAQNRPEITRSNIVCAEPMPGDLDMLKEFISRQLGATPEDRAIGEMLPPIFKAMTLAGEAGSLLKIEQEIKAVIAEGKKQAFQGPRYDQNSLFSDAASRTRQGELDIDASGITDEGFWQQAEGRIYKALESYAGFADGGGAYRRRLFAEDAAQGFAFIDLCRRRYDVVLMNPPFGEPVSSTSAYFEQFFPLSKHDLAIATIEASFTRLSTFGLIGAITTRTPLFNSSSREWRRKFLVLQGGLDSCLDLGMGVLDAMVETAAYTIKPSKTDDRAIFVRLTNIAVEQKHIDAEVAIYDLEKNTENRLLFKRKLNELRDLPNSPLSYWIPESLSRCFSQFPSLRNSGGEAWVGLQTSNDERFLRLWWEVPADTHWKPFPKGGEASPFFADIHLVVKWHADGNEMKAYHDHLNLQGKGTPGNGPRREFPFYFVPGLTWVYRTERFHVQPLPAGCITSTRGSGIYSLKRLDLLFGFLSSSLADAMIKVLMGRNDHPQFDIDDVNFIPTPQVEDFELSTLGRKGWSVRAGFMRTIEEYKGFCHKSLLITDVQLGLREQVNLLSDKIRVASQELLEIQKKIDDHSARLLNLSEWDIAEISGILLSWRDFSILQEDTKEFTHRCLSLIYGCIYGRWDIRYATGERAAPELPDPFAPLPVCPPGMLQNAQRLPAAPEDVPASYPLRISWPGILVDDAGHAEDIAGRVREAIGVIWGERAEAIEQEACEILGVTSLREYLRRPAGFFADHLSRYSKSRRQAPIYWPLAVGSNYTIWLSYHRLTDQTLYRCVNDFIDPKLNIVSDQWAVISQKSGRTAREEKELEQLRDLIRELTELRAEILRVAVFWKPNLNDGVQISAAPLWRLFPHKPWQKKLKETWESLERGDYDWAHLAYSIWPARVREKCKADKSLAIAHGLEELYVEVAPPKAKRGKKKQAPEDEGMFEGEERDRL